MLILQPCWNITLRTCLVKCWLHSQFLWKLCCAYDFIWCKIDIQTPNRKRGGHVVDAPIVSGLPFFSLFGEMGLTMVDNFDFLERYFGIVCTTWGSKMIFHTWSTQQQCHHRFWHQVQANLAFTEYFPHRCFAYIGISWSIASNIIPPNQTCSRLGSVSFSQDMPPPNKKAVIYERRMGGRGVVWVTKNPRAILLNWKECELIPLVWRLLNFRTIGGTVWSWK